MKLGKKLRDKPPASEAPFAVKEWPASKPEMWKLDRIKPYEKNPRTHPREQIKLLAQSMAHDGVTMPILVDEGGIIIAGHGRALAAAENKFEEYPVVIARGWTEQQKQAARIRDNQIGLLSGWDEELLRIEIGSLKIEGYDLPLLGFESNGLDKLLAVDMPEEEEIPESPKHPVVRVGDLWLLGDHRLLCGDATNADNVKLLIGDAEPRLMVTDPPYGVDYDPSWRTRAGVNLNNKKLGMVRNDHRADWREAWALFPGDVAYVWHGGLHAAEVEESLAAVDFQIACQIIWAKDRLVLSRGDYHWQHEPYWYAIRKGKTHRFDGDRSQTSVWNIPAREDTGHGHGTQKPVECMKRPVMNSSRIGEYVYEPFSGSGTLIIACEQSSRKALALELEPSYVQMAIERWQNLTGKQATLDGKTFEQIAKARKTR